MICEDPNSPWPDHIRELIAANPPLPHDEQAALCRCWQQHGDEQARNLLATSTLRFVACIALEYRGRGLELTDLIQEGTLGCLKAIDRFDSEKGFKFISYAVWWIRQAIQKALADQATTIRHPLSRIQANTQAIGLRGALEQAQGRAVGLRESADAARQQCRKNGKSYPRQDDGLGEVVFSLDAPLNGLRAEYLSELASDADSSLGVAARELGELVQALLPEYSSRERLVLESYYGLTGLPPKTLKEIGQELGVTRERVRQIKEQAVETIKKQINGHREEYHALLAD